MHAKGTLPSYTACILWKADHPVSVSYRTTDFPSLPMAQGPWLPIVAYGPGALIALCCLQKGETTWPGWSKESLVDWWPFIKLAIPSKLASVHTYTSLTATIFPPPRLLS